MRMIMRGKESDTVGGEFYQGTSKSAEGYAPNIAFQGAKEEGMHIEVHGKMVTSLQQKNLGNILWMSPGQE